MMHTNQIPRYDIKQIAVDVQYFLDCYPDGMIAIWGQTATGKTALSLQLSEHFPIEVISADSRQIYRYMDIGTDKISLEIRASLPHHLIDIVNPDETYTAGQRQTDAHECVRQIQTRGKIPVIVWGTGLYIDMVYYNFWLPHISADYEYRAHLENLESQSPWYCHALLTQLDPVEAARHHPHSIRFIIRALEMIRATGKTKAELITKQAPIRPLLMIGLWRDTVSGDDLINRRIEQMLDNGFVDEIQHLISLWYADHLTTKKPILYPIVMWYLRGEYDRDECIRLMQLGDRRLAKKQRTWFRRYMRDSENSPLEGITYQNYWVE